jgi:hypothetical protein
MQVDSMQFGVPLSSLQGRYRLPAGGITRIGWFRARPAPALQVWRGVRVEAPVMAVWPRVAQVQLAPYSYDWIDNRVRRSPQDLAGLPEPRAGDRFTTTGGCVLGRIVSVDPRKQLTGTILGRPHVLRPGPLRARRDAPAAQDGHANTRWAAPGLSIGDLIMARRQLLNLKHLAERPSTELALSQHADPD